MAQPCPEVGPNWSQGSFFGKLLTGAHCQNTTRHKPNTQAQEQSRTTQLMHVHLISSTPKSIITFSEQISTEVWIATAVWKRDTTLALTKLQQQKYGGSMSSMAHSELCFLSAPMCHSEISGSPSARQNCDYKNNSRASPAETESGLPSCLVVQSESAEEKVVLNEE